MSRVKFLSAALVVAATLATPALAAAGTSRHIVNTYNDVSSSRRVESGCVLAPRVGAFATQPWSNSPPCEPNTGY